jgi:acetyl esterase/lipase
MRVVLPERASTQPSPAVLVFQGGGYSRLGSGGEAAEWLAAQGIVGILVEYRTQAGAGGAYPGCFADAARAVRLVRSRAAEWGIDPTRVGVLGFSAGGHLAALLSTRPDLHVDRADDLTGIDARPDLLVLAYPVISFVEGYERAIEITAERFFGRPDPDESERREYSAERYVAPGHPPVFLWTTRDDELVPALHSELFADACAKAGVPVRFELFASGPHGMGLALDQPGEVRLWTDLLLEWLTAQWSVLGGSGRSEAF